MGLECEDCEQDKKGHFMFYGEKYADNEMRMSRNE